METLERRPPEPIPAIHPLPEYQTEGQLATWYDEMKQALQVPWMGVVTMAFAHYPTFFGELWRGLRPLCRSRPFVEACRSARTLAESRVAELSPPPITERLAEAGYAAREVDGIRDMIEVFSHGNQAYAVIAAITRLLVEGGEMTGGATSDAAPAFEGRHAPDLRVPFLLMEAHHVDPPTRAVYEDLKRTLNLPFVNTDYRALARWPSYFAMAWGDLREKPGTVSHEDICRAYHDLVAGAAMGGLPNPGGLSSRTLREAAEADAPLAEVVEVCRLFQWLLPGLIVNVAFFRHQMS